MKELHKRSISGLLFAAVVLGAIWCGPWCFAFLFGLFSIFILLEFYQLSSTAGIFPQEAIGTIFGLTIFLLTFLNKAGIISENLNGFYLSFLFVIPALELFRKKKNSLENIAVTLFGIFYIIFPFSLFCYFVFPSFPLDNRYDPTLLIFLFVLIWAFDTGAYLLGVTFGKHRLFERISPKKSWEGFLGGWISCLVLAIVLQRIFLKYDLAFMLLLATIVTIASTFGDLFESMIKRNIGIKDSGKFLPGHGGLLDRFDSILFASPFVYVLIYFFG